MDIYNLMLGDYVRTNDNWNEQVSNKICEVIGLREEENTIRLRICGTDTEAWSDTEDDIEPIPLTPEILEKNEFTHSFGDSDFYDYEKWEKKVDDKTIRVIKDHDGWFCRVDDKKLTRSMGISPAVHTMQNIIRIGGIENEIEL